MKDVVIVAAGRTPIGSFGGALSSMQASDLGAIVIKALLEKVNLDPAEVDEVLLGHVLTAGCGQNPARQAAIKAGLPHAVPAMTINKVCGSGLKALHLAAQAIRCGDADIIVAGGQESMSNAPHILPNSRNGQRRGDWNMVDTMIKDGLWDAFNDFHMGITAENLAEKFDVSRAEQDAFAAESQRRAIAAIEAGKFSDEIIPVAVPQRRGEAVIFDTDENPRSISEDKLNGMRSAFKKDGTVTAGNASSLNDGAAAVIVASREKAEALGLPILATIKAYASSGVDPKIMGIGPVTATQKCLEKADWTIEELELV
jgi:acetyl-CoA C-acetyltransferase